MTGKLKLLSHRQTMRYLHLGDIELNRLNETRELVPYRITKKGHRRYLMSAIQKFLESREEKNEL